jgi:methylglutaconyl-CoA hydratase
VLRDLLAGGPIALASSKRLLAEVPGRPIDEAFAWTAEMSSRLFASEEAREGMAAFLEKRPASWVPAPDQT